MNGNGLLFRDTELWQLLKQGNEKALAVLMDRYYSQLYYYGLRLSGDEEFTEDCLQELFVDLWLKRNSLGEVALIKPYLLKALRRRLLRKGSLAKKTDLLSEEEYLFALVLSPEDLIIAAQHAQTTHQNLEEALNQLPPRQKEAIYLRFYENLSYEEIAQIMTVTVPYLYELIHKATRSLRKFMTAASSTFLFVVGYSMFVTRCLLFGIGH